MSNIRTILCDSKKIRVVGEHPQSIDIESTIHQYFNFDVILYCRVCELEEVVRKADLPDFAAALQQGTIRFPKGGEFRCAVIVPFSEKFPLRILFINSSYLFSSKTQIFGTICHEYGHYVTLKDPMYLAWKDRYPPSFPQKSRDFIDRVFVDYFANKWAYENFPNEMIDKWKETNKANIERIKSNPISKNPPFLVGPVVQDYFYLELVIGRPLEEIFADNDPPELYVKMLRELRELDLRFSKPSIAEAIRYLNFVAKSGLLQKSLWLKYNLRKKC